MSKKIVMSENIYISIDWIWVGSDPSCQQDVELFCCKANLIVDGQSVAELRSKSFNQYEENEMIETEKQLIEKIKLEIKNGELIKKYQKIISCLESIRD